MSRRTLFPDNPPPMLVENPSPITRSALEKVHPWILYRLLALEPLAIGSRDGERRTSATRERKRFELEAKRWRRVFTHLTGAIREAIAIRDESIANYPAASASAPPSPTQLHDLRMPASGAVLPDDVLAFARERGHRIPEDVPARQIDVVDIGAIEILKSYAREARDRADKIEGVARHGINADLRPEVVAHAQAEAEKSARYWSPLVRASAETKASPLRTKQIARERLGVLIEMLGDDWKPADLVDLILASQEDWTRPPVLLSASNHTGRDARKNLARFIEERTPGKSTADRRRKPGKSGTARKRRA